MTFQLKLAQLRLALPAAIALCTAGCDFSRPPASMPHGDAAYEVVPDAINGYNPGNIQAGDRLFVRVLGEPDLTSDQYWVDGDGRLVLPLVGEIKVQGRTPQDVGEEISRKLAVKYIRNPQVAIGIQEHAKLSVTVEGEVQKAGRFEASPELTLLGALALAQSTTNNSKNNMIFVFRSVNGRRIGARFDLNAIRAGRSPDPQIVPGDVVVVGRSALKGVWHDF